MEPEQTYNKLTDRRNLYLIFQTVNDDYDTYGSAIVAAWTEDEARNIHPDGYSRFGSDEWSTLDWTNPENVEVKYIGVAMPGLEGVICSSFRAG